MSTLINTSMNCLTMALLISQNAMVSKATIGRFLNKMGFTGYAAFRKALDITLSKNKISAPFEKNIKLRNNPGITTESIVTDFTYKVSELFNQFKNNIDIESLNAFIDLVLNNKRHIYVVGPSSSHAMATHFCTLLKYFRSNISCYRRTSANSPNVSSTLRKEMS